MDTQNACIVAASSFIVAAVALEATKKPRKKRTPKKSQVERILLNPNLHPGEYGIFLSAKENDEEEFFKFTNMDRVTYSVLLDKLRADIMKRHRRAILSDMKLALTLRYLSQGVSLKQVANKFELAHATAWVAVCDVLEAICNNLMDEYLSVPSKEEWLTIAEGFNSVWGVPNCVGAMDGKHIVVQRSGTHKRSYSVVLMAIVDHDYNFKVVDIGAVGPECDGESFAATKFGRMLLSDTLISSLSVPKGNSLDRTVEGVIPYFFVGEEAFPLKKHVMKQYGEEPLTEKQVIYNYRISRGRRTSGNAFGVLAARWRIFRSYIIASPERVQKVALAAIILHNFIKSMNSLKYMPPGYVDVELPDGSVTPGDFRKESCGFRPAMAFGSTNTNKEACDIRDKLADYFVSPLGKLPWQEDYVKSNKLSS